MNPFSSSASAALAFLFFADGVQAQFTMSAGSSAFVDLAGEGWDYGSGIELSGGRASSAEKSVSFQGNSGEAFTNANVIVSLVVPSTKSHSPSGELPLMVMATGSAEANGDTFRDNYSQHPNEFNARQYFGATAASESHAAYSVTASISSSAPAKAHQEPIPVLFRVNWSAEAHGTVGQAAVALEMRSDAGIIWRFSAENDTVNGLATRTEGIDSGDALRASGGAFPFSQFKHDMAVPFSVDLQPSLSYGISLHARAGGGGTALLDNDWSASGGGAAFIDPILRIDPSYPYLEYLTLEYSEGSYIEVDRLYNPLAGTPAEQIGIALLNSSYNLNPVPEPSQWLMLTLGLGLIGRRYRHRIHGHRNDGGVRA